MFAVKDNYMSFKQNMKIFKHFIFNDYLFKFSKGQTFVIGFFITGIIINVFHFI